MRKLGAAVGVGLALRLVAAFTGWGWFAMDDYLWVIEPAGRWLDNPHAPFISWYRSLLFPRAFWLLLEAGWALTGQRAAALQIACAVLGVWSLLAIPAAYRLARPRLGEPAALAAAWLVAAHFLLPHITTLPLLETVCIPPLLWGLVFVDRARDANGRSRVLLAALGGLLIGVAALFRFHVGVIFPALLVLLAWPDKTAPPPQRWRPALLGVAGLLLGGAVAAALQGVIDLASGRVFLETPFQYVRFNLQHSSGFGTEPFYNYLLLLIALTVPAGIVPLVRPLWAAFRKHAVVSTALCVFVIAHTLVPHKEERFLFPILPVAFVLLGAALVGAWTRGGWSRRAVWAFGVVNGLALLVVTPSDAHRNLTGPLRTLSALNEPIQLACVRLPETPRFYAGPTLDVRIFENLDGLTEAIATSDYRPGAILFRDPPDPAALSRLQDAGVSCGETRLFRGDPVDRVLVRANPRGNRRRRPTALVRCSRGSL